jgi:sugar O-acyltransferase (sialic acid O-acetyltransferase NeuD family)
VEKIVIVGNTEFAKIMHQYISRDQRYKPVAFAVDEAYITETTLLGLPVRNLKSLTREYATDSHSLLLAIGYSNLLRAREQLFKRMRAANYNILRYIHPDARVYSEQIGAGSIIMPNAVIDAYASIGDNSVVWANCTVAHNAKVGDHCWLASGCVLSGGAQLRANTFVGVNATVVNDVVVEQYNIVGANALVNKNTAEFDVTLCGQTGRFRLNSEEFCRYAKL